MPPLASRRLEALVQTRKRKCSPAGRKEGQRWEMSGIPGSGKVTWETVPPDSGTWKIAELGVGVNRIVPFRLQAPPRAFVLSARATAGPPERDSLRSFPLAKKPMLAPSGDQKGHRPSSVPAMGWAVNPSTGRR